MTAYARATDPTTSHEAAASIDEGTSQWFVRTYLAGGPLADHELVELINSHIPDNWFTPQRLRTARKELVDAGLVEFTGIYRLTASGRRAQVWSVVS